MNKAFLLGNLGKDPEKKNLDSGQVMTKFPLATSRKYKNRDGEMVEDTTWHNIVCWSGLAETCAKFLSKGRQVMVEGEIRTRSYDDKEGVKKYVTEIVAQNVQFLGGGNGGGGGGVGGEEGFEGQESLL